VDAHAEEAVVRCLTGHAFRNFFALARDEFDAMARPDWRPLARLGAPRAARIGFAPGLQLALHGALRCLARSRA